MSTKKVIKVILVALSVLLSAAENVDIAVDRGSDRPKTDEN